MQALYQIPAESLRIFRTRGGEVAHFDTTTKRLGGDASPYLILGRASRPAEPQL